MLSNVAVRSLFVKVMLISLSVLMRCFNTFEIDIVFTKKNVLNKIFYGNLANLQASELFGTLWKLCSQYDYESQMYLSIG